MRKLQLFLLFLFTAIFSSSCGFTPKKVIADVNAHVVSEYPAFNNLVSRNLNTALKATHTLTITSLAINRYEEVYTANAVSIYRLIATVDFTLTNADNSSTPIEYSLTAEKFLNKPTNISISDIEQRTIKTMHQDLAQKIIAILNAHQ